MWAKITFSVNVNMALPSNLLPIFVLSFFIWLQNIECITYKIPLVYSGSQQLSDRHYKRSIQPKFDDNLRGKPGQGYYITVSVGNPSQMINVLVDTGSSNFAIAAASNPLIQKYFHPNDSQTFSYIGAEVYVPYTQGNWEGPLGSDEVTIPSAYALSVRSDLACIVRSDKFFINGSNWQGILGLAYPAIARPNSTVVPFFDRLVANRSVSDVFSLQLCGQIGNSNTTGGTMVVGGIDPKLYSGEITYAPLRREWYYEVVLTGLTIGDIPLQIDCKALNTDKTIVDSGTTNFRLPKNVFRAVVELFKRQVCLEERIPEEFWTGESIMCWVSGNTPWEVFPRIQIAIAHSWNDSFVLAVPPQQYLREVVEADSSSQSRVCYKFAISPSDSGTVLGTVIMEGFYLVFDRQNKRLGFAKSTCGLDSFPSTQPVISGPFPFVDPMKCAYVPPSHTNSWTLVIVAYVVAGLCGLSLVPLLIMLVQCLMKAIAEKKRPNSTSDTASLFDDE